MPEELDSTDKLFLKHASKPYNPKLANVFFKSGMIEAWGRGFEKIKEACALYEGPLPEYEISASGIMVLCKACDKYLELLKGDGQYPDHYPNQNGQDMSKLIIDFKTLIISRWHRLRCLLHLILDCSYWWIFCRLHLLTESAIGHL
jgi:ATP-dependent DNA helicase RecG